MSDARPTEPDAGRPTARRSRRIDRPRADAASRGAGRPLARRRCARSPAATPSSRVLARAARGGRRLADDHRSPTRRSATRSATSSPGPATSSQRRGRRDPGAYSALFRGSIYNTRAEDFETGIRPLTETLKFAAPLIAAGLGVGLAFRAGLFNIGGRGQMLLAGAAAGWVGYQLDLPWPIHLAVAIVAGMVAGALWAGIAGLLKARTGAHEVIVTIMLNYVGFYLVFYALPSRACCRRPARSNPKSLPMQESATMPQAPRRAVTTSTSASCSRWSRWPSSGGCSTARRSASGSAPWARTRTPPATAGIDVGRTYTIVMLISGALRRPRRRQPGARHGDQRRHRRPRRRHRLRRHHGRAARPLAAARHPGRRAAVRRVQGRRLLDAGLRGHPGRHRARRPVADRAVHRRAAAGPSDLPTARQGGRSEHGATQTPGRARRPDEIRRRDSPWSSRKAPIMFGVLTARPGAGRAARAPVGRHHLPAGRPTRLRPAARHHGALRRRRRGLDGGAAARCAPPVVRRYAHPAARHPLWLVVRLRASLGMSASCPGPPPAARCRWSACSPGRSPWPCRWSSARWAACSASAPAWSTSPSTASCWPAPSPRRWSARSPARPGPACVGGDGRRAAGGAGARPVRDHLLRRPGHRRRGAQRAGHRHHQLHVQPGAGPQHRRRSTRPPRFEPLRDPRARRHPADRPDLLPADRRSSTCSTSRSRSSPGRSTAPGGACGSGRSASTRRPPTPSASRSTAPATAPCCSPARSRAWAAPSTRWSRSRSSTGR